MNDGNDTFALAVESDSGAYEARLHGRKLADCGDVQVFFGLDERVYVYDGGKNLLHRDVEHADLRNWLTDEAYVEALHGLGEEAVIDIGLTE